MSTINIKFPLQDDNETGFFLKMNELSIDAIKSDLLLLMLTLGFLVQTSSLLIGTLKGGTGLTG